MIESTIEQILSLLQAKSQPIAQTKTKVTYTFKTRYCRCPVCDGKVNDVRLIEHIETHYSIITTGNTRQCKPLSTMPTRRTKTALRGEQWHPAYIDLPHAARNRSKVSSQFDYRFWRQQDQLLRAWVLGNMPPNGLKLINTTTPYFNSRELESKARRLHFVENGDPNE